MEDYADISQRYGKIPTIIVEMIQEQMKVGKSSCENGVLCSSDAVDLITIIWRQLQMREDSRILATKVQSRDKHLFCHSTRFFDGRLLCLERKSVDYMSGASTREKLVENYRQSFITQQKDQGFKTKSLYASYACLCFHVWLQCQGKNRQKLKERVDLIVSNIGVDHAEIDPVVVWKKNDKMIEMMIALSKKIESPVTSKANGGRSDGSSSGSEPSRENSPDPMSVSSGAGVTELLLVTEQKTRLISSALVDSVLGLGDELMENFPPRSAIRIGEQSSQLESQ